MTEPFTYSIDRYNYMAHPDDGPNEVMEVFTSFGLNLVMDSSDCSAAVLSFLTPCCREVYLPYGVNNELLEDVNEAGERVAYCFRCQAEWPYAWSQDVRAGVFPYEKAEAIAASCTDRIQAAMLATAFKHLVEPWISLIPQDWPTHVRGKPLFGDAE